MLIDGLKMGFHFHIYEYTNKSHKNKVLVLYLGKSKYTELSVFTKLIPNTMGETK